MITGLTAEGKMQAIVLLSLPILMLGVVLVVNRPYAMVLFQRPIILAITLVSMTLGALWMRKIINFDY
jgi:tight adherence protein B